MIYWTLKSLIRDWAIVAASATGVALALLLVLYLDAVFRGEAKQIVAFIEKTPGEIWVLQDGVQNLHMASTTVTETVAARLRRIEGVAHMTRFVYRPALIGERGRETIAYVAGIPADAAERQRWQKATGWPVPPPGSVVIPEPLAQREGLNPGDRIRVGDDRYTISAVSFGTFSMANPLVFMDEWDARHAFNVGDGANVLLVEAAQGIDPQALARRIEAEVEDTRALTRAELIRNDFALALDMGGALIGMMGLIGMVVAALIIIFAAYAFISRRIGELAVAKALGATAGPLLTSAMIQTGIVAVLGGLIAVAATVPLEAGLTRWAPEVAVDFSGLVALRMAAAAFIVAEIASLVPAFYVLRVDPTLAFRG